MVEASEEVYSSLCRRFKGDLLRPGESGYEDARTIWKGMVARTPGLIARCAAPAIVVDEHYISESHLFPSGFVHRTRDSAPNYKV